MESIQYPTHSILHKLGEHTLQSVNVSPHSRVDVNLDQIWTEILINHDVYPQQFKTPASEDQIVFLSFDKSSDSLEDSFLDLSQIPSQDLIEGFLIDYALLLSHSILRMLFLLIGIRQMSQQVGGPDLKLIQRLPPVAKIVPEHQ